MKITYLEIHNFGAISSFKKNFEDEDFITISAPNGTGKSTLFKAIRLALFDDYSGNLEDYVNWDQDGSGFSIKCGVLHQGMSILSHVSFSSDGSFRKLEVVTNGKTKKYEQVNTVKNKLNELFPKAISLASSFVLQRSQSLIEINPADRNEFLKKIMDLEFKDQIKTLEIEEIEIQKLVDKDGVLLSALDNKAYADEKQQVELPHTSEDQRRLEAEIKQVDRNLILAEKEKEDYEKKIQERNNYISQKDKNSNDLIRIKSDIETNQKDLKDKQDSLEGLPSTKNREIDQKKSEIDSKILEYQNSIKEIEQEILQNRPKRIVKFDTCNLDEITGTIRVYNSKVESFESAISTTKPNTPNTKGTCPQCLQSIDESHIQLLSDELSQLKQELQKLNLEKTKLEKEKRLHEESVEQNEHKKEKTASLTSNLNVTQEKIKSVEESKIDALNRIDEIFKSKESVIKQEIISLEKEKQLNHKSIQNIELGIGDLDKKIENLNVEDIYDDTISDSLSQKKQSIGESIASYLAVLGENTKIDYFNEALEKEKKYDIAKSKELKKNLEKNSENLAVIQETKRTIKKDFPLFVISALKGAMEADANEFLQSVYPKFKLQLKQIRNGLYIVFGPKEADVKTLSSGAEGNLFNFAFLYAFSKQGGTGCLFLDEIDSYVDEKNSDLLFSALGELKKHYEQIMVISHKFSVKEKLKNEFKSTVINFNGEESK